MTLLLADDHPLTLSGTKAFLESLGYEIEDSCSNGITAFSTIQIRKPDIAILDITMPGMDGLEILEKMNLKKSKTKVIFLTMLNELSVFRKAVSLGAYGYVLKENANEELDFCIKEVMKGNKYSSKNLNKNIYLDSSQENGGDLVKLTFSEKKILELIGQQKTSNQIAKMLFISEKTVEGHRSKIIQKLEIPKEKNALLIWALKFYTKN